jgi:anaerobic magnesium-protoporphyrin IX monomethyl ester cyclase
MNKRKITLIQLDSATPTLVNHILMPRFGLPLIATILRDEGYDVHLHIEYISGKIPWGRILESDAVCFSSFSSAARRTYELADRIRAKANITLIIGGTHATHFAASAETIVRLLDALFSKTKTPEEIPGISYRIDHRVYHNPGPAQVQELSKFSDYSLIKGFDVPLYKVYLHGYTRVTPVQFSRGCHFRCKFCVVKTMFGPGYRVRDVEAMIKELKDKRKFGPYFMFVDNHFAGNRKATKQLLKRIIEEKINGRYFCMVRIDIVKDDELLDLMQRAGVRELFFGFESINDDTLKAFDKRQTRADVIKAVEKAYDYGMRIYGSFVIGGEDDDPEDVREIVDFAIENDFLNLGMFPILNYPGVEPDCELIPESRILVPSWDYMSGNFVTYFPKQMKPSTLQREMLEGYRRFYSIFRVFKYLLRLRPRQAARLLALLLFTHRPLRKHMERYTTYLEKVEEGLYDQKGNLIESRLEGRTIKPIWKVDGIEEIWKADEHQKTGIL